MNSIPHYTKLLFLFVISVLLFSCSNDDDSDPTPQQTQNPENPNEDASDDDNATTTVNIVDLASSVDMLEDLVTALQTADAGLVEALSAEGTFTVFAPNNEAFDALLDELEDFDSLEDFDTEEEKALLADILTYHVIETEAAFSTDLSNETELETLQMETVRVNVDGSIFIQDKTDDEAEVIDANNEASNGVVHIIDKVLLPQAVLDILFPEPGDASETVVDVVIATESLSLLEEAVVAADLVDALNGEGPFTIFAPTNTAIEELFNLLGDNYNSFDDFTNPVELLLLAEILEYHVVPQNLPSASLSPGTVATLNSEESLEIIASGDSFVIGDASNTDANLLEIDKTASNGVVHIVDKILISQEVADLLGDLGIDINDPTSGAPTIRTLVESNDELTFLEEALRLTGLLDTLGEDGPFTVFAPSNETLTLLFGLLGSQLGGIEDFDLDFEIELLRNVLLYHVVPGRITSSDLAVGEATTLLGDTIDILLGPDGFVLKDATDLIAQLTLTDIPASNGVIHVIDRILIPESVIATIVEETEENLQQLLALVTENESLMMALLMAGDDIQQELDAPFTFFLPTNQAFLDLFDQLEGIDSLLDFDTVGELELLATILSYHFVTGTTALSTDLSDGQFITTLQGEELSISLDKGVAILDNTGIPAVVTAADREVLGGVVHFIDKVLLPQEALDSL